MDAEEKIVQELTSMKDRLIYVCEHAYKPDFTVHVGEIQLPSYGIFKTHQGVLAACSGVFRQLFKSNAVVSKGYLHFSKSHSRFFREMLRYMYTYKIEYETPNDFGYIRQHAVAYKIPGLVNACDKEQNMVLITPGSVIDWLDVSFKHKLFILRSRCNQFISNYTEEVFESKNFIETNQFTFDYILRYTKITVYSELVLFKTIMKWIEANEEYYIGGDYDIQSVTKYFLQFVKFICIRPRDFEKVLVQYKRYFSPDVALDIFKVMANPRSSLPTWMNTTWRRIYITDDVEIDIKSGPNFPVQYSTFLMPLDNIRIVKHLSLLQTTLRVRCNWMPTILVGATVICPGFDGKGKVKLRWECHTFGCFEEIANSMSFERHVQVKKNQISIKFPKQLLLETSVVFNLSIKIEYDGEKLVDIPVKCAPSSGRMTLFTPYGRHPYFDGDIIVSEILYL